GAMEPKPDVVSLSNGLLIGIAKTIKRELGIPVVSSLQGEDTFMDSLPEPYLSEAWEAFRKEAASVDLFVPVSGYYGDLMRERLGLAEGRVKVVLNGIDLSPFSPAEVVPERPTIGYLARLHHCKGLHTLVDAFIDLRGRGRIPDVQLRVAGSKISADDEFIEAQIRKLEEAGLGDDIEFRANIDLKEKVTFLRSLSVLSVPATYGESFGLYVVEALACGVPVVQPEHGAFPEVLEKCGGGVLCTADDAVALADELEALLLDEGRRTELGEEGRIAVESVFSIERMAEEFEAALMGVVKPLGREESNQ
ncbi:MAG: glycosyltransferase family 4 protein, partial [Verrucomicrobiales bacterium]|nr:glycosyltransferase family 4 protein [Verrucomicrobiales bacterium]